MIVFGHTDCLYMHVVLQITYSYVLYVSSNQLITNIDYLVYMDELNVTIGGATHCNTCLSGHQHVNQVVVNETCNKLYQVMIKYYFSNIKSTYQHVPVAHLVRWHRSNSRRLQPNTLYWPYSCLLKGHRHLIYWFYYILIFLLNYSDFCRLQANQVCNYTDWWHSFPT